MNSTPEGQLAPTEPVYRFSWAEYIEIVGPSVIQANCPKIWELLVREGKLKPPPPTDLREWHEDNE